MTATHNTGPVVVTGFYPGTGGSNPEAGPSATYQGDSILDVRWPVNPGATGLGHVKGFINHPYPTLVDAVPIAMSDTMVCPALAAATAIAVAAQTFPMQTTVAAGRAVAVPVVPFGRTMSAANAVNCMVLDPGHTIGTTAAGSATVSSVGDTRLLPPGTWVGIVGGGATANDTLITRVIARTANTLTISPAASRVQSGAQIIPLDPTGVSAFPYLNAGATAVFDCYSTLARAVKVVAGASDGGYVVTVTGYDSFLNPMSEAITSSAGTTVNGKKAFKYISGVTVARGTGGATVTTSLSVGTADIFGLNIRGEKWEYTQVFWASAFVSVSTGFTAGLALTTASTTTTADVRGTYAVQSASNGTNRLAIFMSVPIQQLIASTYSDYSSMFGQAQA